MIDASKLMIRKVCLDADGNIVKAKPTLPDDLPRKPAKDMKIVKVSLDGRTRTNRKEQATNGHWQFCEKLEPTKYFGFIYLIEDTVNKRMYIGKKQYLGAGSQNKGVETNWKWYTSSCKALQEAIKANGKEKFRFYVLDQYKIRGSLGYAETWSLMFVRAPANRSVWYNMLVNKISWSVKEDISPRHEKRLHALLTGNDLERWYEDEVQ